MDQRLTKGVRNIKPENVFTDLFFAHCALISKLQTDKAHLKEIRKV